MRILMFEPAARDQLTGVDKRLDHCIVRIALVTLLGNDLATFKPRRVFSKAAIIIDRIGNSFSQSIHQSRSILRTYNPLYPIKIRDPYFEVVAAMTRRRMHKAGAGIVGDVIPSKQRNLELIISSKAFEWMVADHKNLHRALIKAKATQLIESGNSSLPKDIDR